MSALLQGLGNRFVVLFWGGVVVVFCAFHGEMPDFQSLTIPRRKGGEASSISNPLLVFEPEF